MSWAAEASEAKGNEEGIYHNMEVTQTREIGVRIVENREEGKMAQNGRRGKEEMKKDVKEVTAEGVKDTDRAALRQEGNRGNTTT